MRKYLLKRLLIAIPVLIGVTICSFIIVNLAPGDPVDMYVNPDATLDQIEMTRAALGLDQPMYVRYFKWLGELFQGNLGFSFATREPVMDLLADRMGATLLLMGVSLVVGYLIAIPLGILSAVKQNTWIDYLTTGGSFLGVSIPSFFLGLGLVYIFSLQLGWLPTGGMATLGGDSSLVDQIKHMILPVIVLSASICGNMIRYVRSSMLEVLKEDYIRTAKAKGLKSMMVVIKHGLRNSLIPIITVIGMDIPKLIGGAVVTEQIFQWPGLGQLTISSISSRDYATLMAINLLSAIAVLGANMLADILYSAADSRIHYD
ncbi:ABC transporter permease [Isobaculum melis]|uniref:Peptide/nickel transport system permease protein n=1 Tax=Isobaculum melis TaxID=142588 RepID=A0A1H9UG16_9LACT|nr:ABC transporter permease [Isobaculum melis]SES08299.1 peptide/nickel transport system permease protein [Isobaculum melis]